MLYGLTHINLALRSKIMTILAKSSLNGNGSLMNSLYGFDDIFDRLLSTVPSTIHRNNKDNYPPLNIINLENNKTLVEFALAGFNKDELKVYTENGKLVVSGQKNESESKNDLDYQFRGFARRSFGQELVLSENSLVESVEFENGVLTIIVDRVLPEHRKRRDYL
jgi:molecular chaperone IbpA